MVQISVLGFLDTSTHIFPNLLLPATRPPLPPQGPLRLLPHPIHHTSVIPSHSHLCPLSQHPGWPQKTPSRPSLLPANVEPCTGQTSLLPHTGVCHKVPVRAELKISGIQVKLQTQTGNPWWFPQGWWGKKRVSERRSWGESPVKRRDDTVWGCAWENREGALRGTG